MRRISVGIRILVFAASIGWMGCGEEDKVMQSESDATFVSIDAFAVDGLRVEAGESVTASWEVRNAANVVLLANGVPVDLGGRSSGEVQVRIDERTTLRLEATGGDGIMVFRVIVVETKRSNKNPIILSFLASPSELDIGEQTTLSWTTVNATAVEIFDGAGGSVPLQGASAASGEVPVTPDENGTYRLVATGEDGATERTLFLKVRGVPHAELSASKTNVQAGEPVTLNWTVREATRLIIREVGGELIHESAEEFTGSLEVAPSRSTTYELRATGTWRDNITTTTVDVSPTLIHFDVVEKGPIGVSKLATLEWETRGAVAVKLSNLEGFEETITGFRVPEGTARVPMAAGGVFRIVVMGGAGEEVSMDVAAEVLAAPSIASLTVSPELTSQQVQPVKVVVSWAGIKDAEEVRLEGDTFGRVGIFRPPFVDGSLDLWLSETANITLTVKNSAGESAETVTATLVPLPAVKEFLPFPRHAGLGETTRVSWDVEGAETLSLQWNGVEVHHESPTTGTGTFDQVITEPGAFKLVATNFAGGVTEASRAVTVGSPEIRSFTTPATAVLLGHPMVFSWTNRGGTHLRMERDGVMIFDIADPHQIEAGTYTHPGDEMGRATFTLVLTNGLGESVREDLEVVVTDGPVIEEVTLSPGKICSGDSTTVSWKVTNDPDGQAPTLTMSSGALVFPLGSADPNEGQAKLKGLPVGMNEVILTAMTPGRNPDSVSFYVEVVEETSFANVSVSPETVPPGGEVTISWETICADEVEVSAGPLVASPSSSNYVNISSGGASYRNFTSLCGPSFPADDEGCVDINFPSGFTFPFDGGNHVRIRAWANGLAGFNFSHTGNTFSPTAFPDSTAPANFAVFWDDLLGNWIDFSSWGVRTQLVGQAPNRSFIIDWREQMSFLADLFFDFSEVFHFQLVLHEDGTFEYRYGTMSSSWIGDGLSAVVGYQTASANDFYVISALSVIPGGLTNKAFFFGYPTRGANDSYTMKVTSSLSIPLKASGPFGEAETTVQVNVQ